MCMLMRLHAHVMCEIRPHQQRAGQVTPLPGCNRRLLWPLPHPYSLTPSAIKELLNSQVDNQAISRHALSFQIWGAHRVVLVTDHYAPSLPHHLLWSLPFCNDQSSEVWGCGCAACADVAWRYTSLVYFLHVLALVALFKFSPLSHHHFVKSPVSISTLQSACQKFRVVVIMTKAAASHSVIPKGRLFKTSPESCLLAFCVGRTQNLIKRKVAAKM